MAIADTDDRALRRVYKVPVGQRQVPSPGSSVRGRVREGAKWGTGPLCNSAPAPQGDVDSGFRRNDEIGRIRALHGLRQFGRGVGRCSFAHRGNHVGERCAGAEDGVDSGFL